MQGNPSSVSLAFGLLGYSLQVTNKAKPWTGGRVCTGTQRLRALLKTGKRLCLTTLENMFTAVTLSNSAILWSHFYVQFLHPPVCSTLPSLKAPRGDLKEQKFHTHLELSSSLTHPRMRMPGSCNT